MDHNLNQQNEKHQLSEYPFLPQYINIDSNSGVGADKKKFIHYVSTAYTKGKPLLCFHGNPTWSYMYRNVLNTFEGKKFTIAFDHIGCGFSKKNPENYQYTLEQRVKDFDSFFYQLQKKYGFDKIDILAHDWGGAIATSWAVRNPQKVKSFNIFNTAGFNLREKETLPWQIQLARKNWVGKPLVQGLNLFTLGTLELCVTKPLSPEVTNGFLSPYDTWSSRRALFEFVKDIPVSKNDATFKYLQETEALIKTLKDHPVSIGWGLKDFVFEQRHLEHWLGLLPHAKTITFADSHHLLLEDSQEEYLSFLKKQLL